MRWRLGSDDVVGDAGSGDEGALLEEWEGIFTHDLRDGLQLGIEEPSSVALLS